MVQRAQPRRAAPQQSFISISKGNLSEVFLLPSFYIPASTANICRMNKKLHRCGFDSECLPVCLSRCLSVSMQTSHSSPGSTTSKFLAKFAYGSLVRYTRAFTFAGKTNVLFLSLFQPPDAGSHTSRMGRLYPLPALPTRAGTP